ncbi:MAG TPA: cation-transporting P-type ATPase [Blastocatellia bacterium]|nr:cation-transporting P-type ATPase [Blastocatellia bacterium]
MSALHRNAGELVETGQKHASVNAERYPYAASATAVTQKLRVDPNRGLSLVEADERRKLFGVNALQTIRPRAAWRILLRQFASLIIALLAAAGLIAWVTGDTVEALAIVVVLIVNALVGFATEWKANRALDALRRQARASARVRRDGHETKVDDADLVPGDVIILNAGDRVPADARLIKSGSLRTDESTLTGESVPVQKSSTAVGSDSPLAERTSMLYLGTAVAGGHAIAVVTATGAVTELGRIGKLVAEAPDESTPLERRLAQLGHRLVYVVLIIAAVVMMTGWLRGDGLWLMAEVAISLAVAAVPEGLPAVTTLILALGVIRMARENAIVRRLQAVETLGSTSIICADKTGTLTQNRMTVREYCLSDGSRIVPSESQPLREGNDLLARAVRATVLCNEAALAADSRAIGDPTETALLVAAAEMDVDVSRLRAEYPKMIEVPFDACTKRMITVHRGARGIYLVAIKGASAVVLDVCTHYLDAGSRLSLLDREVRERFLAVNNEMADGALRVLALAEKTLEGIGDQLPLEALPEMESKAHLEGGYTFLGFVGMIDPPRPEVPRAVEQARAAGIRVVMLTGDQLNTARAIARELRLNGDQEVQALHARDLDGVTHDRLAEFARTVNVFARVSPEDKLRIVEALVQAGEVVAVTGDGVNDAPALKRASIGVAMGERGTEAAKEAADVVLADDNFATILKAVEGGRTVYANIIKFVHMMFSHNVAEVLVIFVSIAAGWPLALLPLQILWVNLVTDVFPALALAVEPAAPGMMQRPPRSRESSLLSRNLLVLIAWQAVMLAAITLSAYGWALDVYGEGAHARTITLMALIGVQLGHMFNCRSRTRSAFDGLNRNPLVWVATAIVIGLQFIAIYVSPIARVLNTTRLTPTDWLIAVGAVIAPILFVEATKSIARRRQPASAGALSTA